MTLAMSATIVFSATAHRRGFVVRKLQGISIESSWEMLTDRAVITLPRNVRDFDREKVREVFRNGDPVEIWFGYDGNMIREFTGFVVEVSADVPIEIKCEDYMYSLKRHSVNYAMKTTRLQDLIAAIVPEGTATDVADMELTKLRFPKTTAAKVLEKLQESNIYSYFKGTELVVGKVYSDDTQPPAVFNFARNVVGHSLQYKTKDDVMVLVKGTSTLPKGQKITAEFGDPGGTEQSLSYYNITSKDALLALVKEDYAKFKKDGYKGNMTVFGVPSVRHGMKAMVLSDIYPDRNGTYWIKSVGKTFDSGGIRQVLNLDERAA